MYFHKYSMHSVTGYCINVATIGVISSRGNTLDYTQIPLRCQPKEKKQAQNAELLYESVQISSMDIPYQLVCPLQHSDLIV